MSSNDVRNMIDAAVETALARLKKELVESVLASLPAPEPAAPRPAMSGGGGVDCTILRRDVFAAMDGNGQVEILNTLMGSITTHWDRAILFLVKGTAFQPWDARGFEGRIGNDAAKSVAVPSDQDTILSAALSGEGSSALRRAFAPPFRSASAARRPPSFMLMARRGAMRTPSRRWKCSRA